MGMIHYYSPGLSVKEVNQPTSGETAFKSPPQFTGGYSNEKALQVGTLTIWVKD